jgi:hypothetical protein
MAWVERRLRHREGLRGQGHQRHEGPRQAPLLDDLLKAAVRGDADMIAVWSSDRFAVALAPGTTLGIMAPRILEGLAINRPRSRLAPSFICGEQKVN